MRDTIYLTVGGFELEVLITPRGLVMVRQRGASWLDATTSSSVGWWPWQWNWSTQRRLEAVVRKHVERLQSQQAVLALAKGLEDD